ncbi:MAG: hypothetical protein ACXVLT_15975 [Flavisolibacter sp.]
MNYSFHNYCFKRKFWKIVNSKAGLFGKYVEATENHGVEQRTTEGYPTSVRESFIFAVLLSNPQKGGALAPGTGGFVVMHGSSP